jgi:hypothetical protein
MLKMLTKPRRKQIHIGPNDHGKPMSQNSFDEAVAQEGYLYELNKGVIEVSGVPEPDHAMQIQELRDQLTRHRLKNPGIISMIAGGGEAKMLIGPAQSERHPDLSGIHAGIETRFCRCKITSLAG